jgi:N-acetyl-anhydromuramyl-L-alanine amidase AmpD
MKKLRRPVLMGLAGTCVVGLGGLSWLARDYGQQANQQASRPSLLELLDEVRQPPAAPPPGRRTVPAPPEHQAWRSPLGQRCVAPDPQRRDRLERVMAMIRESPAKVQIHPTNYGERFRRDAYGNPLDPTPRLVVLHETVYGIGSAINTFVTPHPRDEDQVSYHVLIGTDGAVVQVLDPEFRAFGAGNSAFNGQWVVTNPSVGGSINNFALHLSLETPADGENEGGEHSGYTAEQYDAVALVLADWMRRFNIPPEAITTHRHVDLGGERADPRSFDWSALEARLSALGLLC